MNWEQHLIKGEMSRGALHSLLHISEFIDAQTFITKSGSLGCILQLQPKTFETLAHAEIDMVTRQFERALRSLDGDMRIYQYVLKRADPDIPTRLPDSPRMQFINAQKCTGLFSLDVYFSIVYEPKQPSKQGDEDTINRRIAIAARLLPVTVAGFIDGLKASLRFQVLDKDSAFLFLRKLANPQASISDTRSLATDFDLDWQIADSSIECEPILRVGSFYGRALTMKSPPSSTFANILHKLLDIPTAVVIVTEWKPVSVSVAQSKATDSKRHYAFSEAAATSKGGNSRVHGGHAALADQIGEVQRSMALDDVYFGQFSLTVLLYSEDPESLSRFVDRANNALTAHNGALTEHIGRSALAAWLAIFPGNSRFQIREMLVSNLNFADMSFLMAAYTGNPRNEHLRDEYLAVVTNNHAQPVYLNLHVGELGHTLILGKSGTGKSFLLQFLIENLQKYRPYTFIFDIMHGFRSLTARMGGSYIELGKSDGANATINPFALDPTEENIAFLFLFVRLLIESDGAGPISGREAIDLDSQIRKIYVHADPRARRLGNLALIPAVSERLDRWVHREQLGRPTKVGQFAYLFDNEADTLALSDFQCFNFPNLTKSPEAMEALLFYVIHRTSRMIEGEPTRPKFIVMDEALDFLKNPATRQYIQHGLQRWRHSNASLVLSTQSLSHLEGAVAQAIFEQCSTRIFAANPGIDVAAYAAAFGMSREQAELITTLTPQRQFLLQDAGIFNLDVDAESLALYSSSPYKNATSKTA